MKVFIISIILVGMAVIGMAVSLLFRRNGRFPETHVSRNSEMQKRGVRCAAEEDMGCNAVNNDYDCSGCTLNTNQNEKQHS